VAEFIAGHYKTQMSKSKCLNAKTTLFYPLDFGLWNLANEIATLRSQ
jgi:hypothetical protein